MADVILGFAGRLPAVPPVLQEGDALSVDASGYLLAQGQRVGRLSQGGQQKLRQMLGKGWRVTGCRVHAVCRRYRDDEQQPESCCHPTWDVILPDIFLQRGGYG